LTKPTVELESFDEEPQNGWLRFSGPKATSQAVVLPVLLFLSLNAAPAGLTQSPDIRLTQLRVLFFALLGAWVYFTVVAAVIDRFAPKMGRKRGWCVLFLFATAETVRTVLFHILALANGLDSDPVWAFRISGGTATGIVFFSIVSVVVNDSQYYRHAYRKLFEQRLLLNAALSSAEVNLERTRDQLIQGVRDQLDKVLRSTLIEAKPETPAALTLSNELFQVAEEVVRPLSHQLFAEPVVIPKTELSVKPPRVPFAQFVRDSSVADPFRPGLLVFIGTMISVPVTFLFRKPEDFFYWIVGLALTFSVLVVAKKFVTPRLPKIPIFLRVALITVIFMIPSLFFAGSIINAVFASNTDKLATTIYGAAIVVFLGWLLAASVGMRTSRQTMLTEISHVNEELYWLGVRLQAELWVDQKNLALTLHNEVQATLLAAALKLKAAVEQGDISSEIMSEVRELISRGINFAATESSSRSLSDAVNRLNENWGGLITMRYTASEETLSLLEKDPVTLGVLEDVLSEFQNNSLKHGQATETTVILSPTTPGVLQLAMTNNGAPVQSRDVNSGLGSTFLTSVSLSQKLENFSRGVKLTVKLPLSGEGSPAKTETAK
jgi:signal transduction histidine kinase